MMLEHPKPPPGERLMRIDRESHEIIDAYRRWLGKRWGRRVTMAEAVRALLIQKAKSLMAGGGATPKPSPRPQEPREPRQGGDGGVHQRFEGAARCGAEEATDLRTPAICGGSVGQPKGAA